MPKVKEKRRGSLSNEAARHMRRLRGRGSRSVTEKTIQNNIRKLGKGPVRLFRANSGVAWQGSKARFVHGLLILEDASKIELQPEGFSDLFGWKSMVIRPADVGKRVAVFVAVEVKDTKGRESKAQKGFLALAKRMGALCGLARSVEGAKKILKE